MVHISTTAWLFAASCRISARVSIWHWTFVRSHLVNEHRASFISSMPAESIPGPVSEYNSALLPSTTWSGSNARSSRVLKRMIQTWARTALAYLRQQAYPRSGSQSSIEGFLIRWAWFGRRIRTKSSASSQHSSARNNSIIAGLREQYGNGIG